MKLVITFYTTTDAMYMEQICKETGVPGRLIPVPRQITAGCGLAWCAGLESEDSLRMLIEERGLCPQEICRCLV